MFKKIWSDPVGSKVIAWIITGLLGLILLSFVSLFGNLSWADVLSSFWYFEIKLGPTIIVGLILSIVIGIVQSLIKKRPTKLEKLKIKFNKDNKKIVDPIHKTTYRFNAYISRSSGFPYITDLRGYCDLHSFGSIIMSPNNGCPHPECEKTHYNEGMITAAIESDLLAIWEKMTT